MHDLTPTLLPPLLLLLLFPYGTRDGKGAAAATGKGSRQEQDRPMMMMVIIYYYPFVSSIHIHHIIHPHSTQLFITTTSTVLSPLSCLSSSSPANHAEDAKSKEEDDEEHKERNIRKGFNRRSRTRTTKKGYEYYPDIHTQTDPTTVATGLWTFFSLSPSCCPDRRKVY